MEMSLNLISISVLNSLTSINDNLLYLEIVIDLMGFYFGIIQSHLLENLTFFIRIHTYYLRFLLGGYQME